MLKMHLTFANVDASNMFVNRNFILKGSIFNNNAFDAISEYVVGHYFHQFLVFTASSILCQEIHKTALHIDQQIEI